jgi:predicted AAA+ superfamily ATPase
LIFSNGVVIFYEKQQLYWGLMYRRLLKLSELLKKKSFFLFGPRATGKTTLIEQSLPNAQVVDLLHSKTYSMLVRNPSTLEEIITDPKKIVVIDEVQKLPELLDEVQRLIRKRGITFLLTGSSARKLKHGAANLLGGRAWEARLLPLVSAEIGDLDLERIVNHGGIPDIYNSDDPDEDLTAYVDTYLREEIKAEAVTRQISAFVEFLDACALSNGQEINYESLAGDLQISPSTLKNYFQILEDTLIGFRLKGFTDTRKRKATVRAKHYLFDLGVSRHLSKQGFIKLGSRAFGDAFEHFIILETRAYLSYTRQRVEQRYWRSVSQFEVDLLIGTSQAIEIKATEHPTEKHLRGLRALMEEGIFKNYYLVCLTPHKRVTEDGIIIVNWRDFLAEMWRGEWQNDGGARAER